MDIEFSMDSMKTNDGSQVPYSPMVNRLRSRKSDEFRQVECKVKYVELTEDNIDMEVEKDRCMNCNISIEEIGKDEKHGTPVSRTTKS